MGTINVSTLKARISEILRSVKEGEEFTVLERLTPVAVLKALETNSGLRIAQRAEGRFTAPAKTQLKLKSDPVSLLLQDRRRR